MQAIYLMIKYYYRQQADKVSDLIRKTVSILIIFTLLASPLTAIAQDEVQYDFSDEAQLEFNKNENIYQPLNNNVQTDLNTYPEHKFKRTKGKKHAEEVQEVHLDAPVERPQIQVPKYDPNAALQGRVVYVPQGTTFNVQLQSGISSGSLDENDKLTAVLPENWIYNGNLIAPAGSLVYGTATDTTPAGYAYGSGAMEIVFDRIMTPDGQVYNINAEKIRFENESERGKNMTRDVLVGAGIGILAGLLFTALGASAYGGSRDYGQAMLLYGAAGAAGGGIKGAVSRGDDVIIDADTVLQLKLTEPLQVIPQNLDTKLPNQV